MKNSALDRFVSKIIFFLITSTFIILILSCVLQVFTRFILNNSFSWTEELSRYSFIWANFLGGIFCTKKALHATVTVITDYLNEKWKNIFGIVVDVIVMLISLIIIIYGLQVTYTVRAQLSPALRISMSYVYAAAPFSALFVLYYSIMNFIEKFQNIRKKGEK